MSQDLVRFGVAMDRSLLNRFDTYVANRGTATNRSEAVRDLVRDALVEDSAATGNNEIVGTITMVFDHHTSDLSDKLDSVQHDHFREIISTMHVHLDAHNCLEVIALKGRASEVHAIAEALLGTKGVKHGKLVTTTTGKELQ